MYSMAREHMPSKLELAKVGAAATLVGYIDHEVKQCRLNATAALYAVSCGGRAICKDISALKPLGKLRSLVNPGVGRSAQAGPSPAPQPQPHPDPDPIPTLTPSRP